MKARTNDRIEYFSEPGVVTPDIQIEIDNLTAAAKSSISRAEESFQNCDTDGFLSQWGYTMTLLLNNRKVEILKNGGMIQARVLLDRDGNIASDWITTFPPANAPWIVNRSWKLTQEDGNKIGRRYIPVGENSRIQKKYGFREEIRWCRGFAKITAPAGSRGLSGASLAYIGNFREDGVEM